MKFVIFRNARWLTDAGFIALGFDGYPSKLAASEFCGRVVGELLRECPGCEWQIDQRSADAWPSSSPVIASGDVSPKVAAIVERAIETAREQPCPQS